MQLPGRAVELDPRLGRDGEVVVEREEDELQVAGVALLRVVKRVLRDRIPQHVAHRRLANSDHNDINPAFIAVGYVEGLSNQSFNQRVRRTGQITKNFMCVEKLTDITSLSNPTEP